MNGLLLTLKGTFILEFHSFSAREVAAPPIDRWQTTSIRKNNGSFANNTKLL